MAGFFIFYMTQKSPALFTPYPRQGVMFPFFMVKSFITKEHSKLIL